jgi:hypothetical protein
MIRDRNRRVRTTASLVAALAIVLTLTATFADTHPLAPPVQASGVVQGLMASTPVLSYQGRLLDPAGNPKPNGPYTMIFSLYEVEAFGAPAWTESKSVAVSGGLFNTLLGDTTPLNLALFDGRPLWLGVTVGAADPESTPRMPIAYVPYALHAGQAGNAETVGGQPPTNFAPSIHIHDERYYPHQDADSRFVNDNAAEVDNLDITDGALAPAKIGGVAWTGANDGANSGLHADLLDGQHGSGYALASHNHWGNSWTGAGTGLTLTGGATGLAAVGSTNGVSGQSGAGNGVYGLSTNGPGVYGKSSLGSGLDGASDGGNGVQGYTKDGYGVRGESVNGFGGFFTSGTDHGDLTLGGAVGRINTDPSLEGSDLILSSNNDVIARLDNDGGENGVLRVKNSGAVDVLTVDEIGNVTAARVAYSAPREHQHSIGSGCGGAYGASGTTLVASVHLPDGARVTRFQVFFYDTSGNDMTVKLQGQYLDGCGYQTLAELTSSGTAGYYSLADITIDSPIVDNTWFAYHVRATCAAWDATLMIKGAVITYTVSEAP